MNERTPTGAVGGPIEDLPIDVLELDPDNPRLDAEVGATADQDEIAREIASHFRAIEVARSIAEHGYFESEPLIAIEVDGRHRVLEGNRRLVALRGLAEEALRETFPDARSWSQLAELARGRERLPGLVPVMTVATREQAWPIIGFRHIAGIQPWDPHAKARFIADRAHSGMSFDEVARVTGERLTNVRSLYRNFQLLVQAEREGADVDRAQDSFGVFTAAMSSIAIRGYIGAPAPGDVAPGDEQPASRPENLPRLLRWLYGDEENDPVIEESRDLRDLAKVLADRRATEELEVSSNLTEAFLLTGQPRQGLARRLERAASDMGASRDEVRAQRTNERVVTLVRRCVEAAEAIRSELNGAG